MREDRPKRIFFSFFLMFNFELKQGKDIKVSVPTLVMLFTLIWSWVVSHSLDTEPWEPAELPKREVKLSGVFFAN